MALKKSDVNYVYQNYLGRDPDEGAIQDLVGQEINRAQLAETILNSDEYKSMTPEDQITRQYQNVLGRGPSDDELQRVMGMDDYFNYSSTTMGSREPSQRLDFTPSVLRNDLMKLPEANLVRVYKNYLGRLPDEEAYRNYLSQFEAEPPKGQDVMGQKSRREQKLVDTNYDFAMDPKRIEEVGWSPEAQEYINSKFEAEARAYAAEKGIELPDDFSSLAQLRNPYQDNRAGMEGLNLMNPISFNEGQYYPADSVADYDVHSGADVYDIPTYAMWFSKAGTAAFTDEEKAKQMVDMYGPAAAVEAYAKDPAGFMKDAAAGVYVNNWLEQNIDPGVTESGANKDKLATLGQKYQDISNRAIELGANPDDIAKVTAQKVDKVAGDYQTYYNDMHENTFMKFLLAAGATMLGAYGLSQVLGAAGTTAAGAGAGAAGTGAGIIPTTTSAYWSGATGLPGYVTGGTGLTGGAGAAAVGTGASGFPISVYGPATHASSYWSGVQGLPGYASSSTGMMPTAGEQLLGGGLKMPTVPGGYGSGVEGLKIPANQGLAPKIGSKVFDSTGLSAGAEQIGKGMVGLKPVGFSMSTSGGLSSLIQKGKTIFDIASDLSDALGGGKQSQGSGQAPAYRNPAELFPVTNTMISPERWIEMTTPRRTFVGGLGAMKDMT
jgi:hypothetical protein